MVNFESPFKLDRLPRKKTNKQTSDLLAVRQVKNPLCHRALVGLLFNICVTSLKDYTKTIRVVPH